MKVIKLPENGTNFVDYEISGKSIDFGDGEMSFRVDKKERTIMERKPVPFSIDKCTLTLWEMEE